MDRVIQVPSLLVLNLAYCWTNSKFLEGSTVFCSKKAYLCDEVATSSLNGYKNTNKMFRGECIIFVIQKKSALIANSSANETNRGRDKENWRELAKVKAFHIDAYDVYNE